MVIIRNGYIAGRLESIDLEWLHHGFLAHRFPGRDKKFIEESYAGPTGFAT